MIMKTPDSFRFALLQSQCDCGGCLGKRLCRRQWRQQLAHQEVL